MNSMNGTPPRGRPPRGRWVRSARKGYEANGTMFEKYDFAREGVRGEGGEYAPQEGFGWSNGAALVMVERYFCRGE